MPRRGALTPDAVVEEAARLVDEEGWEALQLGRLAQRLEIKTPSLYKHVPGGLRDLRRRLRLEGLRRMGIAVDGAGDLVALGRAYRAFAKTYPGLYAATIAAPDERDAEMAAAAEAILATLLTLVGDDVHRARAIRAALHGFVSLETTGGFGLPESVNESFDRLLAGLDRLS